MKIKQAAVMDAHLRKIYKWPIEEGGETRITAYFDELLDAQLQGDQIVVWASVANFARDIMGKETKRTDEPTTLIFSALGTGWGYDKTQIGFYFKTVQGADGLVWHIFVREAQKEDD